LQSGWSNRGPDGRWIDAFDLRPGDLLLGSDGSQVRVLAVAAYGAVATVHNLTVTTHHTYHVHTGDHDILVHIVVWEGRRVNQLEYVIPREFFSEFNQFPRTYWAPNMIA
jgi:hypothetical protein